MNIIQKEPIKLKQKYDYLENIMTSKESVLSKSLTTLKP